MSLQSPPAATAAADLPPGPGAGLPPGAELNQGSAASPSAEEGGEDEEEEEEEGEKEKEREKLPPIPSASSAAAGVGLLRSPAGPSEPSVPGLPPAGPRGAGPSLPSPLSFALFAALFVVVGEHHVRFLSCSFPLRGFHSSFLKITSASVSSDIMKL